MKKIFLFLFLFLAFSTLNVIAQNKFEIKTQVNDWEKEEITRTTWMKFNDPTWKDGHIAYVRLGYVESDLFIEFKTTVGSSASAVVSFDEDDLFYIKFKDGTIEKFKNSKFLISDKGAGSIGFRGSASFGFHLAFYLTEEQLNKFFKVEIEKCRLDLNNGFIEIIPEKKKWPKAIRENSGLFVREYYKQKKSTKQ